MEAIRAYEVITEKGLFINLPEFNKYIGKKVEVIIYPEYDEVKKNER